MVNKYWRIAQSVEHRADNSEVVGAEPTTPTNINMVLSSNGKARGR